MTWAVRKVAPVEADRSIRVAACPGRRKRQDGHMVAVTPVATSDAAGGPVVLYDGTCGLCHRSVRWLLRHERDHALQFAPLQGATAAALRVRHPEIPQLVSTVVLVEDDRVYLRSKAFLYAAKHLRAPWRWVAVWR